MVNKSKIIGFTDLKKWLRHRHPMIYIDRIIDYTPGKNLKSILSVSGTMDCIAGHFPERAIYPGSHLMQGFAQSGIILYQMCTSILKDDEITLIGSVNSRFYKIVVPGDQVLFDVNCDRLDGKYFYFSCKATVDGKTVAAFKGTLVKVKIKDLGENLW